MATSGYSEVKVTSWNTLKFSWETTSQSVANNTSTISWKLQLIATGSGAINSTASKSWVVKVYGNVYSGSNTIGIASNSTKILASGSTTISHKLDGTRTFDYQFSQEFGITFSGSYIGTISGSGASALETINRKATITSAPNFNDEDNPTITYSVLGYNAATLMACISFTGLKDDIPYRIISNTSGTYTFNLTDAERETLRQATLTSKGRSIKFYVRTTFPDGTIDYSSVTRTLTIVNAAPVISPTLVDTNAETLSLTNNGNYVIKGYSNLAYNFNAVPQKGAVIMSYKVTCGSQVGTSNSGVITGADSGTAVFVATDSRGYSTTVTLSKSLINYIKLTNVVYDEWLSPSGELTFNVRGNYFNGYLGATYNSLDLQYRSIDSDGNYTQWQDALPVLDGNTYSYTGKITGLDYTKSYSLRVAAKDTLQETISGNHWTVVETEFISSTPVFDWSRTDFNINVPTSVPSLTVGGQNVDGIGKNKILWEGNLHMNSAQTIILTEPVSEQLSGIVLVFSTYNNTTDTVNNSSFNTFFISKKQIELFPDCGHTFILGINAGFSGMAAKYLTFTNQSITGHSGNTTNGTNSGITFDNSRYVLRYVIGV